MLQGAFALLEVLGDGRELGLTRLAANAELPKGTAHRLLDQLVTLGAVQRRAGRYQLGPRTFRLGQAWRPARALRAAAAQPIRSLATTTKHKTLGLAVAAAGHTIIIGGIPGEAEQAWPLRVGAVLPPGTAAEQILATTMPGHEPPDGYAAADWAHRIRTARERGLAYDVEQRHLPVCCVAAPVYAPSGAVVAALAAVVVDGRQLPSIVESVRRAAGMISANLRLPGSARS